VFTQYRPWVFFNLAKRRGAESGPRQAQRKPTYPREQVKDRVTSAFTGTREAWDFFHHVQLPRPVMLVVSI
jgi:hypothetical protein